MIFVLDHMGNSILGSTNEFRTTAANTSRLHITNEISYGGILPTPYPDAHVHYAFETGIVIPIYIKLACRMFGRRPFFVVREDLVEDGDDVCPKDGRAADLLDSAHEDDDEEGLGDLGPPP
jgi:hypothetical protein